jgi:hypothetical protein
MVTIEDHAENKKPAKHKAKKLMVCSRSRREQKIDHGHVENSKRTEYLQAQQRIENWFSVAGHITENLWCLLLQVKKVQKTDGTCCRSCREQKTGRCLLQFK